MDIMSPELIRIGNCCYRIPEQKEKEVSYQDNDEMATFCTEETCDVDVEVEEIASGKFRLALPIPSKLYPRLVGRQGTTKRKIEGETRTTLTIPRPNQDGDVVITGRSRRDVLLAKHQIDAIIREARSTMRPTHFISLPIFNQEIEANFARFKERVLEINPDFEAGFTSVRKVHFTLVMLTLLNKSEEEAARQRLRELSSVIRPILDKEELVVEVRGLDIWNDDPTDSSVLFTRPVCQHLQEIADTTATFFQGTGFTKNEPLPVKLHITWITAANAIKEEDSKKKISYDFSEVLKQFRDFYFGTTTIKTMHLSKRGAFSEDGYYESLGIVQL